MSFLSPLFLLGVTALVAPVLVHLVRRTRARRVEFPALMFVRQVPQRTVRRKKLHNLLLLLMRSLALLLLILAFARPFFTGGDQGQAAVVERASVILLDRSLSMTQGERFDAAKRQAEAAIDAARADERLALIAFDQTYEIVSRLTTDRAALKAALAGVRPSQGATDYVAAIAGAEALFNEQRARGFRRIFLVSDLQASGWRGRENAFKLPDEVGLATLDVAPDQVANVGVVDVAARGVVYGAKYPDVMSVRVANYGDGARRGLEVTLQINDQTAERRQIDIPARDQAVLEFGDFNLPEGSSRCAVVVKAADSFAPDDAFRFTIKRENPTQVLIVETAARGWSESLYLQQALTTGENLSYATAVKSAGAIDPSRLNEYGLIILNDVGNVGDKLADALKTYLAGGGHVIAAAGPRVDSSEFNRAFGESVAPARLEEQVKLNRYEAVAISDARMQHPIFQIFRDGAQLASVKVFGYHRARPHAQAEVLARFEDGSPALIEAAPTAGGGKFLLYTSTFHAGWSDLPLTRLFLPLAQQMVRYVSERQEKHAYQLGETFIVRAAPNDTGSAPAQQQQQQQPPAIDTPGDARLTERTLTPRGELLVIGREPGFYRLRYQPSPSYVAVNTDVREGDFGKLNLDEFTAALRAGDPAATNAAPPEQQRQLTAAEETVRREETEAGQRIWWPLLIVSLLIFAIEAVLARRTKVAKMIG